MRGTYRGCCEWFDEVIFPDDPYANTTETQSKRDWGFVERRPTGIRLAK